MTMLSQLFFPSPYSQNKINTIPSAPEPKESYIFALYDYQSTKGKKLIYDIKSKRDRFLESLIAQEMKQHLLQELAEQSQYSYFLAPLIVPVPLHKNQLHKRGFNQSAGFAQELAPIIGGRYYKNIIYKNKATKKQALVTNKKERQQNVQGCFSINKKYIDIIQHQDIIIIDDLTTTGATIRECEKILRDNGARNVIAITVAH